MRIIAALSLLVTVPALAEFPIDSYTFGGLSARSIGPAVMSGRIASLDAATRPGAAPVIYVGAASGGVWKSTDGAISFAPVFDDHPQSIGAVRIDPNNIDTVWVGTGESWVRNSVGVGKGVYKSTDAGRSWTFMGLADSEHIGAIRIHPGNSDIVYVCALGHLWGDNTERGVYRTRDGGKNWEQILAVDERTGCADLDLDPARPETVYAAMWEHRRYPDFFVSGGPGSGLYRSDDGGETWQRLSEGLPEGELGRIAVAVAPSAPDTVYAVVEAEDSALFRSDDRGRTWERKDDSGNVTMRPFYFSELVIAPDDAQRVYKPGFTLTASSDGGESFSAMFGPGFSLGIHPDHHALWINPDNPDHLILGTDGGVYVSYDDAAHWRMVGTLPLSQFYHVSHDQAWPYRVMGGLQDNGSWRGPSRAPGGIRAGHWESVGIGDGFWVFADPEDADTLYAEYQGGELMRVDASLNEVKRIKPVALGDQEPLRFNWNTPMHMSPNHPGRLYVGSQYVHYTDDRGESWQTLSPDLTSDDEARQRQLQSGGLTIDNSTAENNATIYTIAESPLDGRVIWAGTDDGLVHVTLDGGQTWQDRSANFDLPAGGWVSRIEASPHASGTAFVTFDNHRSGDMATHVYRTDNYGLSWRSLATEDIDGYAWVIKQDPVNPELLFLGTEHGLFITLDGGGDWARFREGLPPVAVHDIVIHPTEHDVVLGTHGRGIYIIDDISPLRALRPEMSKAAATLLPSRPSVMTVGEGALQLFGGNGEFIGQNPPDAAVIAYYLPRRHMMGDLKVNVYDEAGELVTSLPGGKRRGINKVELPMRLKPPKFPPATSLVPGFLGPRLPEGKYRAELVKGQERWETELELVPDPRNPHSRADRILQQRTSLALYAMLNDLTYTVESLTELAERVNTLTLPVEAQPVANALVTAVDEFARALSVMNEDGGIHGDAKLREKLGTLYGQVTAYQGRPSETQLARQDMLAEDLAQAKVGAAALQRDHLVPLNQALEAAGMPALMPISREEWNEQAGFGGVAIGYRRADWLRLMNRAALF